MEERQLDMRRRFNVGALIAAGILTAAALAGSVTPASAATGSVLHASSRDLVHSCELLGPASPEGYEAVVCVNIYTAPTSTGYLAEGQIEAFCKIGDGTQTVPCQDIEVDGIFANAAEGTPQEGTIGCNVNCPAGRYYVTLNPFNYIGGHNCTSSLGHNVWMVALGDTAIVTPDGDPFYVQTFGSNDDGNYSTGHYWVCP